MGFLFQCLVTSFLTLTATAAAILDSTSSFVPENTTSQSFHPIQYVSLHSRALPRVRTQRRVRPQATPVGVVPLVILLNDKINPLGAAKELGNIVANDHKDSFLGTDLLATNTLQADLSMPALSAFLDKYQDVVSGVEVNHIYTIMGINVSPFDLGIPEFKYQSNCPSWGLRHISRSRLTPFTNADQDKRYIYASGLKKVDVFVLDTGLDEDATSKFRKPPTREFNSVPNSAEFDEHGHGTHVAGIIASKTYGVCRNCRIRAVKVMDSNGMGSLITILMGMQYVGQKCNIPDMVPGVPASDKTTRPSVVMNLSVGGPPSLIMNTFIKKLANGGVVIVGAAGNNNMNACKSSPGAAGYTFTVGAVDTNLKRASFSNHGKCVNAYAPGVDIPSTTLKGAPAVLSGTSMASPMVAGLAGQLLGYAAFSTTLDVYAALKYASLPSPSEPRTNIISTIRPFSNIFALKFARSFDVYIPPSLPPTSPAPPSPAPNSPAPNSPAPTSSAPTASTSN